METAKQISGLYTGVGKQARSTTKANYIVRLFNKQAQSFESARFGWMALLIIIQSCLGSAACMYILKGGADTFQLVTCAMITMGTNALFISLAKPKLCLLVFYSSIVLNTVFLIQNL